MTRWTDSKALRLVLFLALAGLVFAGTTNLDSLTLSSNLTVDGTTTLTGATTQTGALTVAGTLDANGAVAFDGASSIDLTGAAPDFGSNVPTMVTSRTILIPALAMHSTGSVELKNNKATWAIADVTADEFVYATFILPDDLDSTNSLGFVSIEYLCDGTPTEGEWNVSYGGFSDDDADAALTALANILDTSPAQDDWSVTSDVYAANTIIPSSALTAGQAFYLSVGHDVSDQLCGGADVNVASLRFTYTSDQISN